jgi:hypothetical protein
MATEYIAGPTMVLQWIHPGGTINFAADERSVSWSPSVELVDATAGADTVRKRLTSFKDATAAIALVDQTLIIGPEGTAVGKRKITFPAISQGAKYTWPFDNIAEIACDFIANGAYTDSTY